MPIYAAPTFPNGYQAADNGYLAIYIDTDAAAKTTTPLNANGTLLSNTAMTMSTVWTSIGTKVMALGAAQDCQPGFYDIAFFANGTTRPAFMRSGADGNANLGLTTTNLRIATADTGQTTSFPATLGTKVTTNAVCWWAAVS